MNVALVCSDEDSTLYPGNFDEEISQKASTTFDWPNIVKDESAIKERCKKCLKEVREILDKRRLVSSKSV